MNLCFVQADLHRCIHSTYLPSALPLLLSVARSVRKILCKLGVTKLKTQSAMDFPVTVPLTQHGHVSKLHASPTPKYEVFPMVSEAKQSGGGSNGKASMCCLE